MDEGDIAVDDIPIGNVSCGRLVERISLYPCIYEGEKKHIMYVYYLGQASSTERVRCQAARQ
jgi:hypothetical protein